MRYLLDTNIWIFYLKNPNSLLVDRLQRTPASEIVVCSIVWAELLYGARKYERRDERVARVERTLAPFESLPFDNHSARQYATIRDNLEERGEMIGPNDLMISAIARHHNLTVVSNNREFGRVENLPVEDWSIS